jgi:hypothetical protein
MLLLLLLLQVDVIDAVERSKFRTCAQTAFCGRNRAATRSESYVAGEARVDSPEKLRFGVQAVRKNGGTATSNGATATASTSAAGGDSKPAPLFVDFEAFDDAIIRATLFETNPFRYNGERSIRCIIHVFLSFGCCCCCFCFVFFSFVF